MAKNPPAFQFYASDFDVATRSWSPAEVGCYIRLLVHEWINGPLPTDEDRLRRIAGAGETEWQSLWGIVGEKFSSSDGSLINRRIERTREEQRIYSERQAAAGRKGAKARWGDDDNPIGDPNSDPNGRKMALQSSPSTSTTTSTARVSTPSPHPETLVSGNGAAPGPCFEESSGNFDHSSCAHLRESNPTRYVFLAWLATLPPGTKRQLTPERQRKIRSRLKRFPLNEVVEAAMGWPHDPWSDRSEHCDLTILLRSDSACEKFRDLFQSHNGPADA
jgi:uncharacterized protein YdaU (DUF1376 family)